MREPLLRAAAWYYSAPATAAACRSTRWRAFISATARGSSGSIGLADASERALKQSYGLMVNYLYDLDYIERNHEAFAQQRTIVASSAVSRLVTTPARGSLRCRAFPVAAAAGTRSKINSRSKRTGFPLPRDERNRKMPSLLGVLETVLYVDAFERACPFYEQVLGLNSIYRDQRLCAYDVGHRGVLLLFLRGHSLETVQLPGGTIPPHDGHGPVHIAFSIAAEDRAAWETKLNDAGVAIEGRTTWRAAARAFISAIPMTISSNWATPGLWPGY